MPLIPHISRGERGIERKERLMIYQVKDVSSLSGQPGGFSELISALKWGSRF